MYCMHVFVLSKQLQLLHTMCTASIHSHESNHHVMFFCGLHVSLTDLFFFMLLFRNCAFTLTITVFKQKHFFKEQLAG